MQTQAPSKPTMHHNNPVCVLAGTIFPLTLLLRLMTPFLSECHFSTARQRACFRVCVCVCVCVCKCLKHDVIIQSSPVISSTEQRAICERWSKMCVFVLDARNVTCRVREVIVFLRTAPPWIVKHSELHQANRRAKRKKNKADVQVTFCFKHSSGKGERKSVRKKLEKISVLVRIELKF